MARPSADDKIRQAEIKRSDIVWAEKMYLVQKYFELWCLFCGFTIFLKKVHDSEGLASVATCYITAKWVFLFACFKGQQSWLRLLPGWMAQWVTASRRQMI